MSSSMRILAVDTSTWWGGVALVEGVEPGGVIAESGMHVGQTHASALLCGIEHLLARQPLGNPQMGWRRAPKGSVIEGN